MEVLQVLVARTPVHDLVLKLAKKAPAAVPDLVTIFSKLRKENFQFRQHEVAAGSGGAVPSEQKRKGDSGTSTHQQLDSPPVATFNNLSCTNPRGRFNVSIGPRGTVSLAKPSAPATPLIQVRRSDLLSIARVPKIDRQGNVTEYIWVLALKPNHSCASLNKPFVVIKANLSPAERKQQRQNEDAAGGEGRGRWPDMQIKADPSLIDATALARAPELGQREHSGEKHALLSMFLRHLTHPVEFCTTSTDVFRTINGQVSMKCYYKVRDGELFPLASGLLFLNAPVVFIPVTEMAEIYSGRAGAASTKNFDLVVSTTSGTTFEFTMIEREHQGAVAAYASFVKAQRKAKGRNKSEGDAGKAAGSSSGAVGGANSGQENGAATDDEEDDEEIAEADSNSDEESFSDPDASDGDARSNETDDEENEEGDDSDGGDDDEEEDGSGSDADGDDIDMHIDADEVQHLVADAVEKGDLSSAADVKLAESDASKSRSGKIRALRAPPRRKQATSSTATPGRGPKGIGYAPKLVSSQKPLIPAATSTRPKIKVKRPGIYHYFAKRAKK